MVFNDQLKVGMRLVCKRGAYEGKSGGIIWKERIYPDFKIKFDSGEIILFGSAYNFDEEVVNSIYYCSKCGCNYLDGCPNHK